MEEPKVGVALVLLDVVFVAFVPMMGILIPVNSFILEHWLYLPSISLFGLAVWPATWLKDAKDWRTPITF